MTCDGCSPTAGAVARLQAVPSVGASRQPFARSNRISIGCTTPCGGDSCDGYDCAPLKARHGPADGFPVGRPVVLHGQPRKPRKRQGVSNDTGRHGTRCPPAIPRRTVLLFCHIYLSQTVPEKFAAIIWKPREWQRTALHDIRDQPRSVVSAAPGNGCQSLALAVCACVLAGDSWVRSCRNRRGPHVIPIVRANLPRHVLSSAECSMQRS